MPYTNNAKGYIQKSLTTGENLLYQGNVSLVSLIPYITLGLLLVLCVFSGDIIGFGLFIAGIIFWLIAAIKYYTTELGITNKRVIAKTGLIMRNTVEIKLDKIESIRINQGVLGRIFNYGSVIVAGAGNPHAPINGISDPLGFRKACLEIQEKN
jgi:uncharacterized membrane protein YdbT with pleckstrin-like domain